MKILIIVPAYNEGANIEKTIENIQASAPEYDYIIINDCSTDDTRAICEKHGWHALHLPVNLGIGGAVQTGYLYAWEQGYDLAVQVDGDGQHDPAYLKEMVDYMQVQQADMVIGSRFLEKQGFQSSELRRVGIRFFSGLIWLLTGRRITDPTSGLRLVNRKIICRFALDYPKDYPEPETVVGVIRQGCKVVEYPVRMRKREGGVSSISPAKAVYYMIKVSLAMLIERLR